MLPNDPRQAVATIALCHANVAIATGCTDENAIEVFRDALRQMRAGMPFMRGGDNG
jgi:hypothetical protein